MLLTELFDISEGIEDWGDQWVHYSDNPVLSIHYGNNKPYEKGNVRQLHQDPAGIYLFPKNFVPHGYWSRKKFIFDVTIKNGIKVLDLAKLNEQQIRDLVVLFGDKTVQDFEWHLEQYPPKNVHKMVDMAWETIRRHMLGKYGEWNKILRTAGYDAVFDDTNSIHSSETQLLVLNPKIITSIKREPIKRNAFANINAVVNILKPYLQKYGTVEVDGPTKRKSWGSYDDKKQLIATIKVENDKKYVSLKIRFNDEYRKVSVSLEYSNPRLSYGVGADYNTIEHKWESFGPQTSLENLLKDLDKIFN